MEHLSDPRTSGAMVVLTRRHPPKSTIRAKLTRNDLCLSEAPTSPPFQCQRIRLMLQSSMLDLNIRISSVLVYFLKKTLMSHR